MVFGARDCLGVVLDTLGRSWGGLGAVLGGLGTIAGRSWDGLGAPLACSQGMKAKMSVFTVFIFRLATFLPASSQMF